MDYQVNPVTLRQVKGAVITQSGTNVLIDGTLATLIMIADVGHKHFLRSFVERNDAALKAANAVALVLGAIDGKDAQIVISADQWASGANERARYIAWAKAWKASSKAAAVERDRRHNDGEGYDGGSYSPRDRHYPEGA
jgi:hypothetical protein